MKAASQAVRKGNELHPVDFAVSRVGEICGMWCRENRRDLGPVTVNVRSSCHYDRIEVTFLCGEGLAFSESQKRFIRDFLLERFKRTIRPFLDKVLLWEDFRIKIMSDGCAPGIQYCWMIVQRPRD